MGTLGRPDTKKPGTDKLGTDQTMTTPQALPDRESRLDNRIWVTTPEQIRFQYQIVGGSIRVLALLLDLIFMALIYFAVIALFIMIAILLALFSISIGPGFLEPLFGLGVGVGLIFTFVMWWFYGVLQEYRFKGQTWGKMCVGIRVLGIDGRTPTFSQCAWRNFLRLADSLPLFPLIFLYHADATSLFEESSQASNENLIQVASAYSVFFPTFAIAAIAMMASQRCQRIGDLFAGTMVVDVRKAAVPFVPVYNDVELLRLATIIPRGFSPGRELVEALSLYISRRQRFSLARRREIAAPLAEVLATQFELPADSDPDLVVGAAYLRSVCEAAQLETMYDEALRQQPPLAARIQ